MRRRTLLRQSVLVVAAGALAGCSGSGSDTPTEADEGTSTETGGGGLAGSGDRTPTDGDDTDDGSDADDGSETPPQVAFSFDYASDPSGPDDFGNGPGVGDGHLTITHTSGETVEASVLYVRDSSVDGTGESVDVNRVWSESAAFGPEGEVTAGTDLTVAVHSGDRVLVVWRSPGGDASSVLASFEIP